MDYFVTVTKRDGTELATFAIDEEELGVNRGEHRPHYAAVAVLTSLARKLRIGE